MNYTGKKNKLNACFESYQWKSTTMEHKPNQEVLSHAHKEPSSVSIKRWTKTNKYITVQTLFKNKKRIQSH